MKQYSGAFIYLPSLLVSLTHGFILLLIPLFAVDQGSSWLGAGLLFTLKSAGTLIINVPGSVLISKYGRRRPMLLALLCMACACLCLSLALPFYAQAILVAFFGAGVGLWMLGQHVLLSALKKANRRGRALSLIATTQRFGMLLGPVFAGLLVEHFSYTAAFYFATLLLLISVAVVFLSSLHSRSRTDEGFLHAEGSLNAEGSLTAEGSLSTKGSISAAGPSSAYTSSRRFYSELPKLIRRSQSTFVYASIFAGVLKFVRTARQLLIPLWGYHIGLSASEIGLVFSLSAVLDVALIYLGGNIADKRGRKFTGGACVSLLAISLILLPMSAGFWSFLALALMAGAGNGVGGGIIMTLGADLAPEKSRAMFIGAWRLMNDIYGVISPIMIGFIASSMSLGASSIVSGGLGFLGLGVLLFKTQETLVNDDRVKGNRVKENRVKENRVKENRVNDK